MSSKTVASALIALTAVVALLHSQSQPGFSGTWVLDSVTAVADAPTTMVVTQVLVRANVRGEPIAPFIRDITIARGDSRETFQIGTIGGSVSGTVGGALDARRTHQRVSWEGQVLIIERGSFTGAAPESGEWTVRRESWSIDSADRLRLRIATRGSRVPTSDETLVYRRQ